MLSLVAGFLYCAAFVHAIGPTVDLKYAQYRGNEPGSGVSEFLGMQYAQPPLGNLRWRAPKAPLKSKGVVNATQYQPICAAVGSAGTPGQSEDCLYVNIFTPSNATVDSKLPVYVWNQGGGFVSNSNANYNGTTLALQGPMVVVTFNYRVGAFGFLASKKIKANGDLNVGLLDERMVYEWVQTYIAQFGGDPGHVVIDGDSAGANSVMFHLAAYGGRNDNLFIGAIAESVWSHSVPPVSDLEFQFDEFANASGCGTVTDVMSCLRNASSEVLWSADVATPFPGRTGVPFFAYGPVIDGTMVQPLYEAFRAGNFIKVPMIIGSTTNEGSYFAPNAASPDDIINFFLDNYQELTPADAAVIPQIYPLASPLPEHNAWFSAASAAYGESTLICPANTFSSYAAAWSNSSIYHYRYNVIDPANEAAGLGTPHVYEIPAVWGPLNVVGYDTTYDAGNMNAAIVPVVMDYWVSFVTELDPNARNAEGAPVWQALELETPMRLMIQTGNTSMEGWPAAQVQRCAFWEGLAGEMQF